VHQVPSNREEHEKDSDDNIDAGHLGDEPRCGWTENQDEENNH
jgi:hypothetical protein